jgi:hypothetical protein
MSTIDVKKVFIFASDSEETIKKKIAYHDKTLPQYIKVNSIEENTSRATQINYSNITTIAIDYEKPLQYIDYYNRGKEWKELSDMEILRVWLYENRRSIDPMELMQVLQASLKEFFESSKDKIIQMLSYSHKRIQRDIKDDIEKFLQQYKKEYKNVQKFYKLEPKESTEFTIDRSNFQIIIENKNMLGKFDVFENIVTSINVPYCKVYDFNQSRTRTNENVGKTYTKVNNLILPNEEWINGYDDVTKLQTNMEQTLSQMIEQQQEHNKL